MRCIATLLLSALALPALVRAEGPPVQVDAASGLWFPPYASPADYLQRDPNHPYLKDVQRAWSEQPGLRQQVCAAVQKVTPMTADPAIHQLRALLDMQCIGVAASQHLATQQAAKADRVATGLAAVFAQQELTASSVPPAERKKTATDLIQTIGDAPASAVAQAFLAIALWPGAHGATAELLATPGDPYPTPTGPVSRRALEGFLEGLYRQRASAGGADAAPWREGLPVVLLYLGDVAGAQSAVQDLQSRADADSSGYARTIGAVIDAAAGQPNALAPLRECAPTAEWKRDNAGSDPGDYCFERAAYMVEATLELQGPRAPAGLAAAARELIAMRPHDWDTRMSLLGQLMHARPRDTAEPLRAVTRDPDAPQGAVIDAVYYLATEDMDSTPARAPAEMDCWLKLQGLTLPAPAANAWERLAALPEGGAPPGEDCFGPGTSAQTSRCAIRMLELRFQAGVNALHWDVARQSIEQLLALVLANGLRTALVRDELVNLAMREHDAGVTGEEPGAIVAYLAAQPHGDYVAGQLRRKEPRPSESAREPWTIPTSIDSDHLTGSCPPR